MFDLRFVLPRSEIRNKAIFYNKNRRNVCLANGRIRIYNVDIKNNMNYSHKEQRGVFYVRNQETKNHNTHISRR